MPTDIRIIKPTGALMRNSPNDRVIQNIVGAAHYGDVLRGAELRDGWWTMAGGRYIAAAEAQAAGQRTNPLGALGALAPRYFPLSQRDPRWKDQLLGNTNDPSVTIGDFGCLLTCFTVLINSALDKPLMPGEVNDRRKANGGYLPPGPYGGYAARFNVDDETGGAVKIGWFSERYEQDAPPDVIPRLQSHLKDGQPAILEVDFFPSDSVDPKYPPQPGRQMHFVLALPANWPGRVIQAGAPDAGIMVIDPWDGQIKSLTPRFGQTLARAVVRAVLYENWVDVQPQPIPPGAPAPQPAPAPKLPPPIMPQDIALGVHTLTIGRSAQDAFRLGCRWFTVVDSFDVATGLAGQGAVVLARRNWPNWLPDPEQFVGTLGALGPGVYYLGMNENDSINDTPDAIRKRAAFDVAVAQLIRQRSGGKSRYVGGGFSMGTPDLANPQVCAAIRDGYSAAYNAGLLLFNQHTYVPEKSGARSLFDDASLVWWPRRWEFYFTRCGFDPRVRGIVSAETGVDNGKGFAGQGFTRQEFSAFVRRWREVMARPMLIDNQDELVRSGRAPRSEYPGRWNSPFLGGSLFQLTPRGAREWGEFNISEYVDTLRDEIWPAQAAPANRVWA